MPCNDFVTGGCHYVFSNSNNAGTYAGTPVKIMNFGLVMKWNPSGKNLQGNVNIIYRRMVGNVQRYYKIKSNAIQSLAVSTVWVNILTGAVVSGPGNNIMQFRKAVIVTKANFSDITDPLNPVSLGGNLTLTLEAFESVTSNNGAYDRIGVMLTGNGQTGLMFSSYWSNGFTVAQQINGGKIQVRNGSTSFAPETITKNDGLNWLPETNSFSVLAYPNPSASDFSLMLEGGNDEKVQVIVYDITGKPVKTIENSLIKQQVIRFGADLRPGIYMAEVKQGNNRKTIKLVKQ
jgi:hypothetical protein